MKHSTGKILQTIVTLVMVAFVGLYCIFFYWYLDTACDDYIRPVYRGDISTFDCTFVGPCQDFELDNEFVFSVDWREGGDLELDVLRKNLPDGATSVIVRSISVKAIENTVVLSVHQGNSNIELQLRPVRSNSADTGINVSENIPEGIRYRLEIHFVFNSSDGITEQQFIGEFTRGELTTCHSLV